MARKDWKTRGKKVAVATVAALVSVWALYVVLINVFLSTSLFDRVVNQDKMMLDIHYEGGWSVWPSTIHAKNLSIRSSDSNLMWVLELDEVKFDVSLLDLPRRRFTIGSAHGRGISMRIQTKRLAYPETMEEVANLPPIDGFPAYAVRPADPHHPELWDDEQYKLIDVHLDGIQADDVREIWIDDYRFAGHADIKGRFHLKPLREVDVGPVHIDVHSGEVQRGLGHPIVRELGGELDVYGSPFDPRDVHENQAIRYFDIGTKLHAKSIPLSQTPFEPPGFYVDGVVNAKTIELHIEKGHLVNGTKLDIDVEQARFAKNNYLGDGALTLHAAVADNHLRANSEFATWRVVRADGEPLMLAPRGYIGLDSAALDLATKPFEDVHVVSGVDGATVPDARLTNCILPCSIRVKSGHGSLTARAEIWPNDHRVSASGRLKYDDLHVKVPDLEGRGSGDVRTTVASYRWDTGVMEGFEIHGEVGDGSLTAKPVPLAKMRTGDGSVDFRAERVELANPLHASWDANLLLSALSADEGISVAKADLALSHRKDSMALVGTIGGGRVANGAKLSFLPFKLTSENGQFEGDVDVVNRNEVVSGKVNVRTERLGIQNEKVALVGNIDIAVDIRRFVAKKELDLGPSKVEARNVRGYIAGKQAFNVDRMQVDGVTRHLDLVIPNLKDIDAHVVIAGMHAPDVKALQPLLDPKGKLKLTGGAMNVEGEVALGGHDGASGKLVVDALRAGVTHGESTLIGDMRLQAKVAGISDNIVNISGSRLAVRNVQVTKSSFETTHWSSDVVMSDAVLDWASGDLAFGADIDLSAQDARPVLGMLDTPKIAGAFVTMPNLAMRAHVDAAPQGILVRDVYAHGGDVAFRGSYAVVDGDKKGAFVVSKGPIAMGVRIGDDGAHPHFFGLDGWLRDEEKKVKAAPIAPGKP